jgi:predicted ATPase
MPALLNPTEFEALQRKTQGATRERMLRELAEALEVLTAEQPLLLVLEDLHWSDPSTLEFLSFLARRRQTAQLLILGSYRPVEALANGHPLRAVTQELQLHQHCQELPLQLLSEGDTVAYLTARLPIEAHSRVPLHKRAHAIHQRTEGNPLFMVNITEEWLARGEVESAELGGSPPTTIRQMIERHFDHLTSEEQRVLAVASVAGIEFSAAAVIALSTEQGFPYTQCPSQVVEKHGAKL